MSPRKRAPLKVYLTAFLALFIVLITLGAAYQGYATVAQAEERRQAGVDFRADLAASDIQSAVEVAAQSVSGLAATPGLLEAALSPSCTLQFDASAPFTSGHLDILDTDGKVICSSLEEPTAVGYVGAPWLTTEDESVLATPVEDAATGQRALVTTTPVTGGGVVASFLDVDTIGAQLSDRLSGSVDTRFALVDPASGGGVERDDRDWLDATAAVPSLGWNVRAWTDRAAAVADAETLNDRMLVYLLGCILLLMASVLLLYRGIARPIERLSASVRGVMAGSGRTVDVAPSGPAEVVALAENFATLVEEVQTELAQRRQAEVAQARAQAEREANAAMLFSIIQSTQSLVYVKDLDGRYLMVNASFLRSVGKLEKDILGYTDTVIDPEKAAAWMANDRRARDGRYELQEWAEGPDGLRHFESVKFPLHDSTGKLYATCGVSLDVTSRRRATAVIAEARDAAIAANAAKSTFLATMSHEIRTPMTAVIGMADLLSHTSLDPAQQEFVATVQSSGEALLSVINDILDISKIEAGELACEVAPIQLPQEIEQCLDLLAPAAAAKGLELLCLIDESCPAQIMGDVVRLRQIVTNLVANAVKFTEHGEVLVEVTADSSDCDDLVTVHIAVSDTGIGISEDGLAKLFKSFSQVDASTTRTYGGTGLGLVIAQRLAEAMDGRITVTSTPGAGSTFDVTVVLGRCPGVPAVNDRLSAPQLTGRHALVVDDNVTHLRILERKLAQFGMTCTTASTTSVAMSLAAGGLAYDVALVDLTMPGRDQQQLYGDLRALYDGSPDARLVLMSEVGAYPRDTVSECAEMVTKPVKSLVLRNALEAALGHCRPLARKAPPLGHVMPTVKQLRVLLAEDNPVNQRVVELMLNELGHRVDVVADGRAAVQAIRQQDYDVVLMDVQMPRMDGLEATRTVRARTTCQQPAIIAMTASTLVDDREACAAAGMDSYLSKPLRSADLARMLEQTTSASGRATPAPSPRATTDAAAAPPGSPPIDESALDLLLHGYGDRTAELRAEVVGSYLAEGAGLVERLAAAAAAGDHATAANAAHSLRSPSALLGAAALAALLEQTESAARGSSPGLRDLVADVAAEYTRASRSFERLVSTPE